MEKQGYLAWMSENTITKWTNDSAVMSQLNNATENGSVGTTTNPPLSYEGLTVDAHLYKDEIARLSRDCTDDEFALEAMGIVVKNLSKTLMPMHEEKGSFYGCVRAQVAPNLQNDAEGMFEVGKKMSSWGKNVMIKIPGTQAGLWALEELAAIGIPTNPTVLTTMSQIVAAAEAFERGCARAVKAGITPAWSTEALVFGRLQDYLSDLNVERKLGLATSDLEWAAIALVKRSYEVFKKEKFKTVMQGAAFRCAMHVEQLVGGPFCSTIHPKVQDMVAVADAAGLLRRESCIDSPADKAAVDRVIKAVPEYSLAYELDAIKPENFGSYGAVKMTLDNFEVNGWQKLISLKA